MHFEGEFSLRMKYLIERMSATTPPDAPLESLPSSDSPSTLPSHESVPEKSSSASAGAAELSDEQRVAEALKHKDAGNRHFQKQEYEQAITEYTAAIEISPKDHPELAVFYSNRAACYVKKESHEAVVTDCTAALRLSPRYLKALQRRARAHETLHHYPEATADYRAVLEIEPHNADAQDALRRLPEAQRKYEEQQKAEAMAKLKELGNSFLGLFGMSVDQFRFQQDPSTGNYSVSVGPSASSASSSSSVDESASKKQ